MKTATFVSKLKGYRGDARLYRLSPPATTYDGDEAEYVIVSAADVPFSGPETYIFPAHPDGKVMNWTEMDGSFRGGLNHEEALRNAGYTPLHPADEEVSNGNLAQED